MTLGHGFADLIVKLSWHGFGPWKSWAKQYAYILWYIMLCILCVCGCLKLETTNNNRKTNPPLHGYIALNSLFWHAWQSVKGHLPSPSGSSKSNWHETKNCKLAAVSPTCSHPLPPTWHQQLGKPAARSSKLFCQQKMGPLHSNQKPTAAGLGCVDRLHPSDARSNHRFSKFHPVFPQFPHRGIFLLASHQTISILRSSGSCLGSNLIRIKNKFEDWTKRF